MDVDRLLQEVIEEVRAVDIPVAKDILPHVRLNQRATARFGSCTATAEGHVIEVSARLLAAGERAVKETLAHEVLHTCWGCASHGKRWRAYAARLNAAGGYHIARKGTWESVGLADQRRIKYILVCEKCGAQFRRARASSLVLHPERYRCRCGGRIRSVDDEG